MPIHPSHTELYQSYSMLHQDGTLMCYCAKKKAQWYIQRGLAHWVGERSFQLDFTPNGHGKHDKPFYTQQMENRCVVCGATEHLNKHHVVPYVFRSRLPLQYKESNHHDILATCVDCHEAYEHHAMRYKHALAAHAGMSLHSALTPEQKLARKIRSARSFLERFDKGEIVDSQGRVVPVPPDKLNEMRSLALQEVEVSPDVPGAPWADKIIQGVMENNHLAEFVQGWRAHFVEHAKPRYLPPHWRVDSPLEMVGV